MQAGLGAVLKYFSPQNLEDQISQHASIASKVPGVRESKLWKEFVTLYERIAKDAETDFQRLFASEFAEAYERQIKLLASAGTPPGQPES